MKLRIKQSSWSGDKSYVPEEIEKEYEIKLEEKYIIKTMEFSHKEGDVWIKEEREIFSFQIAEADESTVKIRTYQSFSDNEDGSVNLRSDKKEFSISTEKPLKLITPTMDFGYIFILSLVK